jgi:hypothetical protein
MAPLGMAASLGLGAPRAATSSGAAPATSKELEEVAVVGNTAALEAITNEDEGFIAYNDETFQLWVSSEHTTASLTLYTKQESGI